MLLHIRRLTIARLTISACLLALVGALAACTPDGTYYTKVSELDASGSDQGLERVRVGGVFAEAPVTTSSGTVFTMAEEQGGQARVRVYHSGTEPVTASQGSKTASGSALLGTEVIVTGYYVDGVIVSDDMIVKQGGGYREE